MPSIYLNEKEYPVKSVTRTVIDDDMPSSGAIERRVGRPLVNFRTEGELGYPYGLGYRWGPAHIVSGGISKGELRVEIPGQITLPLLMSSETESAGDLSGEVAAAGRLTGCNTEVGSSTGKPQLLLTVGTKILRCTSDSDPSLVLNTYAVDSGVTRIYTSGEVKLNSLTYYGIGTEDPTTDANRGFKVSTDASVDPIVFADVETSSADTNGPGNTYWFCSIDSLQRTYICWETNGGAAGTWGNDDGGRPQMGYLTHSDALSSTPTILYTHTASPLHKGCQLAGVIGNRLWIIDPVIHAQASPDVHKRLCYIDPDQGHLLVEVPIRLNSVTMAARYDHPQWGPGIVYTDDRDSTVYHLSNYDLQSRDMGWKRHQGRDAACTIKGFQPTIMPGNPNGTGERLGVLVQHGSSTFAWFEEYIPNGTITRGNPDGGIYGGSWYPFSKRFVTTAALILPGGTPNGTVLPWGLEQRFRYFVEPDDTSSIFVRQLHWGVPGNRSNTITRSLNNDDFEDGPLSAEFPLFDPWGGVEETGRLLAGFYEGGFDSNSGAPSSDETVLWEYTTDLSTYPDFTTFTSANQTSTLASGGVSVRAFGLRVTLNRGATTTKTPNGAIFVARGLKIPATRQQHTFEMAIEGKVGQNVTELTEIQSRLETARDASSVLLEYDTYSVYVNVKFAIKAIPQEGKEEEKITVCTITCTEVT